MKKVKVFLVHGIRSKDQGKASMKVLKEELPAWMEPEIVSYGYVLVPISNKRAVSAIIEAIEPWQDSDHEIVVVAYSNGAWTALMAAEMGYRIDHMILISPALHRSHAIPEHVRRVDVYHSPTDKIVTMGKWYRRSVNVLPWNWPIFGEPHGWGDMGRVGYTGNDKRVHNHNMGRTGHSWFKIPAVVQSIASDIVNIYQ